MPSLMNVSHILFDKLQKYSSDMGQRYKVFHSGKVKQRDLERTPVKI